MTFGRMIIMYVEIGLVLAIIEPILWKLFDERRYAYFARKLTNGNKADRCGFAIGMIIGSMTGWPIHLITWYIIDPIIERHEKKIEP